jgi:hypothetical protein
MLSALSFTHVLVGEPATTSPEHALASSSPAPAIPNALPATARKKPPARPPQRRPDERLT